MKVKKLDHIGIAVHRLDEATRAYEALGLGTVHVEEVLTEKVRVAMLPLGDTRIELLEPSSQDSVIARFLEKRGEGIHHLALEVENLEAACEELRAAGLRLVYDTPREGEGGSRINFIHPASTHGVLIELRELP